MFHHRQSHEECGRGWRMSGRDGGEGGERGRGRGGPFGRHRGGPFGGRGPRMFDPGALRLVVLGLIAEEPRHGYDIIKALEQKLQGAYSPSPGAIYPMLQMLEEADLVVSRAEGNKRLFSITEQGKVYLEENATELARINAQIASVAERMGGAVIGEEFRALRQMIHEKMRGGAWNSEQAAKARGIIRQALKDLGEL
jgi:DNA-binding PadR family transcriptional regulator